MSELQAIIAQLPGIKLMDILDIAIVAFLIYKLLPIFRSTGTGRIAWVVLAVIVISWLTEVLKLHMLNFILSQLLAVGLVAVVVLFQPELRRMLDQVMNIKFKTLLGMEKPEQEMMPIINQTVKACETMSRERVGALLVFARSSRLEEYFKTGTMIDGQVSEQLLRNIFFPRASLHDGAVIICDGRVAAAGCVLPLSESSRISADLGTRHRAAVGVSEVSDAVVVVVSEETGAISVAVDGMLKRHLAPQTLKKLLCHELCPEDTQPEDKLVLKLRQKLQKKEKGGKVREK
ncbi:MAG: diadenylate cyclase CdaA [Oscillospiraceae bacterium]|nr:diadenylate cyclase CdaA [Oscillospiraceae bacterium]